MSLSYLFTALALYRLLVEVNKNLASMMVLFASVLPLGVLICRSKFIPKAFGILFIIEVVCGLLSVVVHFLVPNESIETVLLAPGTIAEFSFVIWLLIRGINTSKLPVPESVGESQNKG